MDTATLPGLAPAYTITDENGCKVINGNPTVEQLTALLARYDAQHGGSWVGSQLLARHLGAVFVCGPQRTIDAWCDALGLRLPVRGAL